MELERRCRKDGEKEIVDVELTIFTNIILFKI
jgi:hypothetical protein